MDQSNRQMNQMSGECRPSFTPKQGQYLAFIDAYTRVHRRPPAEREMQRHFGVTPPSVHQMVLNLERAGLIRRQPGVPRSIEVLVPPEDLPVLQHISSRSKPLCRGTSDKVPSGVVWDSWRAGSFNGSAAYGRGFASAVTLCWN